MTRAEMGISLGYGGIWNNIEYSEEYLKEKAKQPKKVMKYERVFDYDDEDKVWDSEKMWFFPDKKKTKKKYFIDGDSLYKLVNPDGELFSWMKGVDPVEEWKRTHDENGELIKE